MVINDLNYNKVFFILQTLFPSFYIESLFYIFYIWYIKWSLHLQVCKIIPCNKGKQFCQYRVPRNNSRVVLTQQSPTVKKQLVRLIETLIGSACLQQLKHNPIKVHLIHTFAGQNWPTMKLEGPFKPRYPPPPPFDHCRNRWMNEWFALPRVDAGDRTLLNKELISLSFFSLVFSFPKGSSAEEKVLFMKSGRTRLIILRGTFITLKTGARAHSPGPFSALLCPPGSFTND